MKRIILLLMAVSLLQLTGCSRTGQPKDEPAVESTTKETEPQENSAGEMENAGSESDSGSETYEYTEYPLERNGVSLHLDCMKMGDWQPENNILLVHGATYSSHEFDIDYEDYSLVRRLAREGYAVWRLDIAGYGQSGEVEDGLMPDTAYAAEDIRAAMERIESETGQERIDLLGWSWGTMTTGLYAGKYPEHLGKLVLYAPILSGLGEAAGTAEAADNAVAGEAAGTAEAIEPFRLTDWEGAAEDFQTREDGSFDLDVTDPVLIEMWCSSCWHYDGDSSPNAWRKDAFVSGDRILIDLEKITVPTLVICGDKDPYLNYDLVNSSLELLPEGSELKVIPGGSHVVMYEKELYREFQDDVVGFLCGE